VSTIANKNTGSKGSVSAKRGKGRAGTYLAVGTALFSAFNTVKKVRTARSEGDTLMLVDAVIRAAAMATGLALLVREMRGANDDDILTD
jgi:hypothetical protein